MIPTPSERHLREMYGPRSGSSVPEAARDAALAAFHRVLSTQQGTTYGAIDAALEAAAPFIVAAAVAEERATRRATQDAIHADLSDLLDALGMGTHARPDSPHAVMQQAIAKVRALAEERATTGRRIEALEGQLAAVRAWHSPYKVTIGTGVDAWYCTSCEGGYPCPTAEAAGVTVRAALASPGGRWMHITRGDECPEQPTPSQTIGNFRPVVEVTGGPWWCTTHQDHLRWVASPGEGDTSPRPSVGDVLGPTSPFLPPGTSSRPSRVQGNVTPRNRNGAT